MDKKNAIIGIGFGMLALGWMAYTARQEALHQASKPPVSVTAPATTSGTTPQPKAAKTEESTAPAASQATGPAKAVDAGSSSIATKETPGDEIFTATDKSKIDEKVVTLSNDLMTVEFTNYGGAIRDVVLKKFPESKSSKKPFVLNKYHFAPTLSFLGFKGAGSNAKYTLVSKSATEVVFRVTLPNELEITRKYEISAGKNDRDPYLIRHETTFRNISGQPISYPRLAMNLGSAAPINVHDTGYYLNVGYFDGKHAEFINPHAFGAGFLSHFFGKGQPHSVVEKDVSTVWASVKNEFFVTLITPDKPAMGILARRVEFPLTNGETKPRVGVTGSLLLSGDRLAVDGSKTLGFDVYTGPKEYFRLANFNQHQDYVMQFGWFGWFAKLLLKLMIEFHKLLGNYGLAIIATTILIKLVLWPFTAKAAQSSKRMAKIQGPLKELKEKYKDDPKKQQEETLKLFKENRVNPLGGCLPMVVQIPIFFGLYRMIGSAAELRFAHFLWIKDLSAPDTIAHLGVYPVNILPLLMIVTQVINMRMMPTPTVDNAQAKMMKFMPLIFFFFFYNMASGLVLYWTVQNIFTIFQQYWTNHRPDKAMPVAAGKAAQQPKLSRGLPTQPKKKKKR